jgi:hypothetical protein
MSQEAKRRFKIRTEHFFRWIRRVSGREPLINGAVPVIQTAGLKAGDVVRVRSREEISAMLNAWHEMKGCLFMPAMWGYCGTVQVVLKPVERFVDERDYRVKHAKGLVILQGLLCSGSPDYGRCDRACFYFWREEWLEKISEPEPVETEAVEY